MGHSSQPHWHCPPPIPVERKRQTANNPLPKEGDEEILFNFYTDRSDLTEVQIPETVKGIGSEAFMNCTSLVSVNVPKSVYHMAGSVFTNCTSLKTATIPAMRTAGPRMFMGCSALEEVNFDSDLCYIEIFCGCSSLKTVNLSENLKEIASGTFKDCTSLEKIVLPASLKEIHAYAFEGCTSLKTLEFKGVPRTIHRRAFAKLKGIQSLIIPEGSYESFAQMLPKTIIKKANQPGDTSLCQ